MITQPGAFTVLDEAAALVRRLPRWVGVLWVTAIPARLLIVHLLWTLARLGREAVHHGDYLTELALLIVASGLVSACGRRLFVRACQNALAADDGADRGTWRVPPADLAATLFATLAWQVVFWGLLPMVVPAIAVLPLIGLAAVEAGGEPGPWRSLRATLRALGATRRVVLISLMAGLGLCLCLVNLHVAFRFVWWLAGSVASFDAAAWSELLSWSDGLYVLLLGTAASLLVEPFWLAALAVHAHHLHARETGEDLRRWFAALRAPEAA